MQKTYETVDALIDDINENYQDVLNFVDVNELLDKVEELKGEDYGILL